MTSHYGRWIHQTSMSLARHRGGSLGYGRIQNEGMQPDRGVHEEEGSGKTPTEVNNPLSLQLHSRVAGFECCPVRGYTKSYTSGGVARIAAGASSFRNLSKQQGEAGDVPRVVADPISHH